MAEALTLWRNGHIATCDDTMTVFKQGALLTRGGGSYEDLFPFNLEPVVRAIVRAKHPVLSAIGHTQDVHLSDYAADFTCETPSNAAQFFGEIGDRYIARIGRAGSRIENSVRTILTARAQAFDAAERGLGRASCYYRT